MGQEITHESFTDEEREQFLTRLREETALLRSCFEAGAFSRAALVAGFEIEGWLVDDHYRPNPVNQAFLAALDSPLATPELARFNIELNVEPLLLAGDVFSHFEQRLQKLYARANEAADRIGARLLLTGILPTLRPEHCSVENMSGIKRYAALNAEIARARNHAPIELRIDGVDHIHLQDHSVMLESATTSLQLHLQVPADEAHHYYNASIIASAPLLAGAVNSPFLFGRQLWQESRIAVFEQSVDAGGEPQRVSFGSGYAEASIVECFEENLSRYPVLLPELMDEPAARYGHLRLHNGAIWRWNRPLIGFDADGRPHIRIEQRVLPAGPTIIDMMANAAFYYGLTVALYEQVKRGERLPFATARDNFYRVARGGLGVELEWQDGRRRPASALIVDTLLPQARAGLRRLGIDEADVSYYLGVFEARVRCGQTGAQWQIDQVTRHGKSMGQMTRDYYHYQRTGLPVHAWGTATTMTTLKQIDEIPDGLLTLTDITDIWKVVPEPTLLHLEGRRKNPLFVSVLLHGNEDTGFLALQKLLKKYRDRPLPRSISIFFGNIEAARKGVRRLDGQPDYNRVWPGTRLPESDETRLMRQVVDVMATRHPFASIDMHNNTGKNPHYGCINYLDHRFEQLAVLFSHIVVFFQTPKGVQSMAMARLCPSITVECGKPHEPHGVQHAFDFLDTVLHLEEIPNEPLPPHEIDIFHTVARVTVPEAVSFSFGEKPADIVFSSELDSLNFSELPIGTEIARVRPGSHAMLQAWDEEGNDVSAEFFAVVNDRIVLTEPVMPSMLTLDARIIRQDCLCYLMERIDPDEFEAPAPI